ncbi:MAG: anaerobic sulfatase maturase [Clostridia bacterium]|nr:anaerobic sulfatase maturase [Clostridia bacterium]
MGYANILIKPASSLCNMRCRYCFYADESEHRMLKSMGIMTRETARQTIDAMFALAGKRGEVSFSFQGGEPTIAGLDFFRDFTAMVADRNTSGLPVRFSIQTNGLNLNAEWADLLHAHRFMVGISVDGDRTLHDRFRPDAAGNGTWERVTEKVALLLEKKVETNILCVVNGQTAQSPKKVYRALKALGTGYLQFIPCLDPLGKPRGSMDWSLTAEGYGRFLCGVFDDWYRDWERGQYVSVRQFDDWVHLAMGMPPGTCASSGQCGGYLVAEADGSLYPCDFYVLDEWRLGSVADDLKALLTGETMRRFRQRSLRKPRKCASCRYFRLCRGGCPRDWEGMPENLENGLCAAFQMFFDYAAERILYIASLEQKSRPR